MIIKDARYDVNFFANITPTNGRNKISKASVEPEAANASKCSPSTRTDTIQISSPRPGKDCACLKKVKKQIMDDIGRDASPEKLRKLKSRIDSGSYMVDADELARILSE